MIIATRTFEIDGNSTLLLNLHAPEREKSDWRCRFDINWPDGKVERYGSGVDAVQSILHALQMIGAELCTSSYSETGRLRWMEGYEGFGFPVPANIRDLLAGDDAKYL